tara:strand:- start:367 stop:1269 length:903 start_codon:yes stop_codon:yes gene_type:complete
MINTKTKTVDLRKLSSNLRRDILMMITNVNSGHAGGSLSELEILITLYQSILNIDPINPDKKDRDRFILSKGHASPGLYAVLSNKGFFPRFDLGGFRKLGSHLQGHTHIGTPGVEMSGGSLGQGLSFGVGIALAEKIDKLGYKTFVLLGDGECEEGQIWEAAMSASHYNLSKLTAIVDRNKIQNDRFTDEVSSLEPLDRKWTSFGWNVIKCNGHNYRSLASSFAKAQLETRKPTVIIADTVKGKGISFMENNPGFHGKAPSLDQLIQALHELNFSKASVLKASKEMDLSETLLSKLSTNY